MGVEEIIVQEGRLQGKRTVYNGKIESRMACLSTKSVFTVQPGSYKAQTTVKGDSGKLQYRQKILKPDKIRHLETRVSVMDNSAIKEAKVIVAAGRGIEEEDNLELIRKLARLFDRSAVAGSRPLCDIGWLDYNQQVGTTGTTVTPELYLACGISGTSQHVNGMKGSGYIVALNKDPHAAIFNVSDLVIVEDLASFIPILIEEYHRLKNSG